MMKKKILYRNLFYLLLVFLTASCSKMDATYKQFVVPNGVSYIGKADSIRVYSGRQRVKIAWLRGTDPKVSKAVIYWNNKADSVEVPIMMTDPNDTVSAMISNLPEGSYSFYVYTFDDGGHNSVRVDVLGNSYDSLYESGLLIRPIDSVIPTGNDAIIKWFDIDTTSFTSEVIYTDVQGNSHKVYVPLDSATTTLKNYKFGTSFAYRSLYRPDAFSIDTFYTDYDSVEVKVLPQNVNLALNKEIADKSSDGSSGRATNLIDGDPSTYWQPLGSDRKDDKMVDVTIDLGSSQTFDEVHQFWTHGHTKIASYNILYSDDNSTWKTAASVTETPDEGENKTVFPAVKGRYVKLELHFDTDGNVNIAELGVYNVPQAPPVNLALDKPINDKSSDGSKGRIAKVVDGDMNTFWQPLSADRKDDKMVWVIIDLEDSQSFNEMDQYWKAGDSHINGYKILYSDDATTWATAFEKTSGISSEEKATFPPVKGRYVKLELNLESDTNLNVREIEIWYR